MKHLITILFLSLTSLAICQSKKMYWHTGGSESAYSKAEKLDAIIFMYIYPENSSLTTKVNETYFTPQPSGSWEERTDVIDLHNNNMVSIKYTAKQARAELGNNYDLSKPIFIWMNAINNQPIKYEIINTDNIKHLNLISISETVLEEQFEKNGKSHPAYEFKNIKKMLENKDCDNILCQFDILHGIFLKMPDDKKQYMFEELSYNPGNFNSLELKWIMQQEEFLELGIDDKMEIFYNALTYSFAKNTPNIESLTEEKYFELFDKYANNEMIKPLGKFAQDFKQYLIDEDEGKGFK